MRTWAERAPAEVYKDTVEKFEEAMKSLCCMTPLEKWHHMYSGHWGRPTDSTFIEVKRPDKMTHT